MDIMTASVVLVECIHGWLNSTLRSSQVAGTIRQVPYHCYGDDNRETIQIGRPFVWLPFLLKNVVRGIFFRKNH